jgi:hypothetical protein
MRIVGLEYITSNIAIGSIVLAAIASAVQAFVNLRPLFKSLTSSSVWEIIIAIPFLLLCYLIGLIVTRLSAEAFDRFRADTISLKLRRLSIISRFGEELFSTRYEKLMQELELLQAACPSIGLLSIGLLIKALNATPDIGGQLEHGRVIFGGLALSLIAMIIVLLFLISRTYKEMCEIASLLALPVVNSEGEHHKVAQDNLSASKTA